METTMKLPVLAIQVSICVAAFVSATSTRAFAQPAEWSQVIAELGPHHGPSVFDTQRGVGVLIENTSEASSKTWEWNGSRWTLRSTSGPSGRANASIAYDPARGVTVLFGGRIGLQTYLQDTWEWDGSTWTQRNVTGPSPRWLPAMAYDAARNVVV